MNLAIISPSQEAYSETFIKAHKKIKADKIFFYYGGYIPTHLENYGLINISKEIVDLKTILKLGLNINLKDLLFRNFSLRETLLAHSFRKNKIDVVLAEYGPTAAECLEVCKKLNIPLIPHFHGYDVSAIEQKHKQKYKDVFDYSSYVVGVSKDMIKSLQLMGAPEEKLVYTPCGPNEMFYKNVPDFKNQNLIFIGRLVDKKAPYYLILAFQRVVEEFPEATLTIVGEGPLLETCNNLVKSLGLSEKIFFTGRKTQIEVQGLLNNSYAYIQHSIETRNGDKEGTPVGIMEASAAALPVISTTSAGIKDVVINEVTGLLSQEHDIESMALNIKKILSNPEMAKEFGDKGRKFILEKFSLENHLNILSEVISKAYNNSN